jgi:Superinfection immunity protein
MHDGVGLLILTVLLAFYCIPMLVAMSRSHRQLLAIVVLNFLLGWTLLGWVGALVWACTNPASVHLTPAGD